MQTQGLKERVAEQKKKLQKLAKLACRSKKDCGRDGESAVMSQSIDPAKWNKGWGKYGKT